MQKLKDQSTESWVEEVAQCPQALATLASCYQRLSLRTHIKMEEEPLLHKAVYLLTIHTSVMVAQRTYVICTHNNEKCKRLKATALRLKLHLNSDDSLFGKFGYFCKKEIKPKHHSSSLTQLEFKK